MAMLRVLQEHERVQRRRIRRRAVWVKPWIERRLELGQYSRLMEELRLEDVLLNVTAIVFVDEWLEVKSLGINCNQINTNYI